MEETDKLVEKLDILNQKIDGLTNQLNELKRDIGIPESKYLKCPCCGEDLVVNISYVLPTLPGKYQVRCSNNSCNYIGFIPGSDINKIRYKEHAV